VTKGGHALPANHAERCRPRSSVYLGRGPETMPPARIRRSSRHRQHATCWETKKARETRAFHAFQSPSLELVRQARKEATAQRISSEPRGEVRIGRLARIVAILLVEHVDHGELRQHVLAELLADLCVPGDERRQATTVANVRVGTGEATFAGLRTPGGAEAVCEQGAGPVIALPAYGSAGAAAFGVEVDWWQVAIVDQVVFREFLVLIRDGERVVGIEAERPQPVGIEAIAEVRINAADLLERCVDVRGVDALNSAVEGRARSVLAGDQAQDVVAHGLARGWAARLFVTTQAAGCLRVKQVVGTQLGRGVRALDVPVVHGKGHALDDVPDEAGAPRGPFLFLEPRVAGDRGLDRKSTRLNSSHV